MIEMSQKNVAKYAADVVRGKRELKDFVPEEAEPIRAHIQKTLDINALQPLRAENVEEENIEEKKELHELSPEQKEELILTLKERFHAHPELHGDAEWGRFEKTLRTKHEVLWSVQKSEDEGAEPTIYTLESSEKYDGRPDPFNENKEGFYIGECFDEKPPKRPRVPYDRKAEEYLRHKYPDLKIVGNAKDMAKKWGFNLMSEKGARHVAGVMGLNLKNSTWIETPDHVRGGSSDSVRNEKDYFANYATHGEGGLVQRAKVYDRDEAFKTPRFQLQVYWA